MASRWSVVIVLSLTLCFAGAINKENSPSIFFLHIKSDIKYRFATTLVTSRVVNPDNVAREVIYDVTLPNEAFMTNFTLELDDRIHVGEVKEKEEAKRQYARAQSRGQSAGLVKAKPRETNKFNIHVNVEAMGTVTFNLTYQELLRRKIGKYSHVIYVNPGQLVDDFQIEVAIYESRDITTLNVPPLRNDILTNVDIEVTESNDVAVVQRPTSRSAYILYRPGVEEQQEISQTGISGQFVVEYDVDRQTDAGDLLVVNGYFVHFFGAEGLAHLPKDVVFILDQSGSMSGRKIIQLREAMLNILDEVDENDRFNIMTFNGGISYMTPGELLPATDSNIDHAKQFVTQIRADGMTNIDMAMTEGIRLLAANTGDGRASVLIFLTDGQPTAGERNPETILENISRYNELQIPIFSLAFGTKADYSFLKKMAAQNNGLARKIYEDSDAALQIEGFYDEISTVLLKNVTFTYLNDAVQNDTLSETNFNTYFDGSEILVAGRLADATLNNVGVSVSAQSINGMITLTLPNAIIPNNELNIFKDEDFEKITEKLWAYLTIKQKLRQKEATTSITKQEDLKQEILQMSLKYNFVTPLTSMVVTLTNEMDELNDQDDLPASFLIRQPYRTVKSGHRRKQTKPQYLQPAHSVQKSYHPKSYGSNIQPSLFSGGHGSILGHIQRVGFRGPGGSLGIPSLLDPYKKLPRTYRKLYRQFVSLNFPKTTTASTAKTSLKTTSAVTTTPTTTTDTISTTTARLRTSTTTARLRTTSIPYGENQKQVSKNTSPFIIKIHGIREPLCLDLRLKTGKRYRLLEDSQIGFRIFANTGMNARSSSYNKKQRRGVFRTHLSLVQVESIQPRDFLTFQENAYNINGTENSWTSNNYSLDKFYHDVSYSFVIHSPQIAGTGLKVYVDIPTGSGNMEGLLETFASIQGKIIKIKTNGKRTVAKLKLIKNRNLHQQTYKLRSKWYNHPITGVMSCWELRKKDDLADILNIDIDSYEVQKLSGKN